MQREDDDVVLHPRLADHLEAGQRREEDLVLARVLRHPPEVGADVDAADGDLEDGAPLLVLARVAHGDLPAPRGGHEPPLDAAAEAAVGGLPEGLGQDHAAQPAVHAAVGRERGLAGELGDAADNAEDGRLVMVPVQIVEHVLRALAHHGVVEHVHGARVQAESGDLPYFQFRLFHLRALHDLLQLHLLAPSFAQPLGLLYFRPTITMVHVRVRCAGFGVGHELILLTRAEIEVVIWAPVSLAAIRTRAMLSHDAVPNFGIRRANKLLGPLIEIFELCERPSMRFVHAELCVFILSRAQFLAIP